MTRDNNERGDDDGAAVGSGGCGGALGRRSDRSFGAGIDIGRQRRQRRLRQFGVGGPAGAREANSKTVANVPILNQVVPHNDYVAQCQSSVSQRRVWSIPLTVIGVLGVAGALLVGGRRTVGSDTH